MSFVQPERGQVNLDRLVNAGLLSRPLKACMEAEARACTGDTVWYYDVNIIPGLFQSADYARWILSQHLTNPAEIEGHLAIRLYRQRQLINKPRPPVIRTLIPERSLHNPDVPAGVLRKQVARLVGLSGMPQVAIQLLPDDVLMPPGMPKSCIWLQELMYQEVVTDGGVLEKVMAERSAINSVQDQLSNAAVAAWTAQRTIEELLLIAEKH